MGRLNNLKSDNHPVENTRKPHDAQPAGVSEKTLTIVMQQTAWYCSPEVLQALSGTAGDETKMTSLTGHVTHRRHNVHCRLLTVLEEVLVSLGSHMSVDRR